MGPRFEPGLLQQVAGSVLSRYPLPADSPFVNQFFNLFFGGRQKPGPLVEFVTRQCWQTDQGVMSHRFGLVENVDLRDRLERIAVPTLVLAGDRDLLVTPDGLREMGRRIPRSRAASLPRCGHFAFVTHPDLVGGEVKRFLESN